MGLDRKVEKPEKDPVPRKRRPFFGRQGPRGNPVQPYQKNRKLATPDKSNMTVLPRDFWKNGPGVANPARPIRLFRNGFKKSSNDKPEAHLTGPSGVG
jgi:hypothetical protein